jgi:DsbC/DsbD-like thiol-disulfide interchange protein
MSPKMKWTVFASLTCISFATLIPFVHSAPLQASSVTATLVADTTAIAPGAEFTLAVRLDVPSGYYTYYRSPGDIGVATKMSVSAPSGFVVGPLQFPGPEIKREDLAGMPVTLYVYNRSTMVLCNVKAPETLDAGGSAAFTAQVSYQYCRESGQCFPPKPQTLKLSVPLVANRSAAKASSEAAAIEGVRRALPESGARSKGAKVRAVLNQDRLRPGDQATLAVVVDVDEGHQLPTHRSGSRHAVPTEIVLDNIAGVEATSTPVFPDSNAKGNEADAAGYRGRFVIRVPIAASDSLTGPAVRLSGLLHYQARAINGSAQPARFASWELNVPVAGKGDKVVPVNLESLGSR